MKKIVFIFFILLACTSKDTVSVIGSTNLSDDTNVYLVEYVQNRPILKDSTTVKNGSFSFNDSISFPEMHYLFFKNVRGSIPLILEPGKVELYIDKDSIFNTTIRGTISNKEFEIYKKETEIFTTELSSIQNDINNALSTRDSLVLDDLESQFLDMRKKLSDYEFNYIKESGDSYISSLILRRMIFERSIDYETADTIYNGFTDYIKGTSPAKEVKQMIDNYKLTNSESPRIGSFAPKFSGPGLNGEIISLNGIESKYILLDFWASWCAPCRVENPDLSETLKKYSKEDFAIVGVSLDNNEASWKQAIKDDGIENWIHISSLKYFNDPIAKLYDVGSQGVPTSFLIDPERRIIAKNLKSSDLEATLNVYLKINESK